MIQNIGFTLFLLMSIVMMMPADASIGMDLEREYNIQLLANSVSTPMACKLFGQRYPDMGIDVEFMKSEIEKYKEEVDALNAEDRERLADNIYQHIIIVDKMDCDIYYKARKDMIEIFKLE